MAKVVASFGVCLIVSNVRAIVSSVSTNFIDSKICLELGVSMVPKGIWTFVYVSDRKAFSPVVEEVNWITAFAEPLALVDGANEDPASDIVWKVPK